MRAFRLCIIFFLKTFPNRASSFALPQLYSHYHSTFLIFIKFTQILKYTSELPEFLSDTAQQRT